MNMMQVGINKTATGEIVICAGFADINVESEDHVGIFYAMFLRKSCLSLRP